MTKVRIAIIGAGVIGKRHAAAIRNSHNGELAAIADPFAGAQILADKLEIPRFEDAPSMLDATKPDAVIVATPTENHLEPSLAGLGAGAHVLVEKPITASLDEAVRLSRNLQQPVATFWLDITGDIMVLWKKHAILYEAVHWANLLS